MNTEKISILITCFNGEKFIDRCITSIFEQTYKNFVIIFLNDGSNDNTKNVVEKYIGEKLVYFENEKNMGRGFSRNKLLNLSVTKYSCWCDIDDYMHPQKIEKQINYMIDNNITFLSTEMFDIDGEGNVVGVGCNKKDDIENLTFEKLNQVNKINHPTVIFKTEIAKKIGFNEKLYFDEDWDFYKRLYNSGHKVYCLPEPLYYYKL